MNLPLSSSVPRFLAFLTGLAIVAALFLAKGVLIPVAVAILLSFLLAPIIKWFERRRFSRVPAVITTAALACTVLGAIVYLVAGQVIDLADSLPRYRTNLLMKATALKPKGESPWTHALKTVEEVSAVVAESAEEADASEDPPQPAPGLPAPKPKQKPIPVEVVRQAESPFAMARQVLSPILSPIGDAAVIFVMVIFMLLGREDLRDRVIHLMGRGRLQVTTQALDEAARRVSRYLLAQLTVNATFGVPMAIGLFFIGVPNAILWGLMSIILRFLPYVGSFIAAGFPLVLSMAVSTSWSMPLMVIGLVILLELITNNFIEPWLYGASTGLSPLAIIVAAVFWTWLWGGVGLVLATPLTVCLAVLGKHLPALSFLDLLLGDRPPIAHSDRLYQRLLALDEEEAEEIVELYAKEHSLVDAFDTVLMPALSMIERQYREGTLPESVRASSFTMIREIISDLSEDLPNPDSPTRVLCLPAQHEADELAALALAAALRSRNVPVKVLSSKLLAAELMEEAAAHESPIICISTVPPASVLSAVSLARRLRARLPGTRIGVGLWQDSEADFTRRQERFSRIPVDEIFSRIERAAPDLAALADCSPTSPNPANGEKGGQHLSKSASGAS